MSSILQLGLVLTVVNFVKTCFSTLGSAFVSLLKQMRGNKAKWANHREVASKSYVDQNDQCILRRLLFIPTNKNGKNKMKTLEISETDKDDPIASYQVRSCRILHHSFSWIATALIKLIPKLDYIDHWWVTIETENGKIYNLQLFFSSIALDQILEGSNINQKKMKSDQHGLAGCYLQNENSGVWSQPQYSKNHVTGKTMNDVIQWFKSDDVNADFDFFRRNCQDLCRNFYRSI